MNLAFGMIFAKTPQAKGRIECLWDTLQSRLPIEFAMNGIETVADTNKFLEKEYVEKYNRKFSIHAEGSPIYVPLKEGTDIDNILCIKHKRKTDNTGTFSFKNRCFQILDEGFPIISARREINVLISPRFGIKVEYKSKIHDTIRYVKPKNKKINIKVPKKVQLAVKPHLLYSIAEWKNIWWYENYNLSLKFLYELFFEKQQSS